MKKVNLFDCEIASLTMNETLAEIDTLISNKVTCQHVVLNAGKIVLMQNDKRLKKIIQNCSLINADGQSVVWASKLLGKPIKERVAGIDLMEEVIKLAEQKEYKIYFFGAKENVVTKVIDIYKNRYPKLKVVGYRNGYFEESEVHHIINEMKNSQADILFVAFSSPKKEYWLSENMDKINIPFCMGVGGSFDVVAGKTKRAPLWMQNLGLEWFYRLIQEPRRMWKRYLIGNSKFIYLVLKEKLKR